MSFFVYEHDKTEIQKLCFIVQLRLANNEGEMTKKRKNTMRRQKCNISLSTFTLTCLWKEATPFVDMIVTYKKKLCKVTILKPIT